MSSLAPSNGLKNQAAFERLLAERFPAIAAAIDDIERGLLHVEMAVLARATCEAIDQGDTRTVCSHLNFIDELFACCAPDLENAIYVSYLENVFLGPEDHRYVIARKLLSDSLQNALTDLERHWKSITESIKNR